MGGELMMDSKRRPSVLNLNGNVKINREASKKDFGRLFFFLLVFRFQLPYLRAFRWS